MTSVTRLNPGAFDEPRRQAGPAPSRAASRPDAASQASPTVEPGVAGVAADVFAAHLQRAMPAGVATRIETALDATGARSGALAAQDRLAAQILSIANVAGGRVVSLAED